MAAVTEHYGRRMLSFETDYLPFARAQMARPIDERVLQRFPVDRTAFARNVRQHMAVGSWDGPGGWRGFLLMKGFEPVIGTPPWLRHRPLPTRAGAVEAVRRCHAEGVEEHGPGWWMDGRAFDRLWAAIRAGEDGDLPVYSTGWMLQEFGHWANVLAAAGVIDERVRRRAIRRAGRRATPEQARAAVRAAQAAGVRLSKQEWSKWRHRCHEESDNDAYWVPSAGEVLRALGVQSLRTAASLEEQEACRV